jgi:hypothetical protein
MEVKFRSGRITGCPRRRGSEKGGPADGFVCKAAAEIAVGEAAHFGDVAAEGNSKGIAPART